MKLRRRNKKGFTLVEVMIVVAIIGLLAAIAIPNLLRARVNANDGSVRGDLRAFSTAAESFRAAQSPPAYPGTMAALTSADPPYLDATWLPGASKHGHTVTYTSGASGYTLQAATLSGQAATAYCIDQTGVLFLTSVATAGTSCSGGAVV